MGVTIEQKLEALTALIKKCEDVDILIPILNAAHDRINEIIEEHNEEEGE